jgi:hypothetical protein
MSLKFLAFTVLIVSLICCDEPPRSAKNHSASNPDALGCYRYANERDTFHLKVIITDRLLTGSLVYDFGEKDKSEGIIRGQLKGDLLLADYTYRSEGTQSTRQVVFKYSSDTFTEGHGPTEMQNGKMVFSNIDSLYFSNAIIFRKLNCE